MLLGRPRLPKGQGFFWEHQGNINPKVVASGHQTVLWPLSVWARLKMVQTFFHNSLLIWVDTDYHPESNKISIYTPPPQSPPIEAKLATKSLSYADWIIAIAHKAIGATKQLRTSEFTSWPCWLELEQWLLQDPVTRATQYNSALDQYKTYYQLRSGYPIAKKLKINSNQVELPLWFIKHPNRTPAQVIKVGNQWAWKEPEAQIAPRALLLTYTVRKYLATHFVHGFGGAKYEDVNHFWAQAEKNKLAPFSAFACTLKDTEKDRIKPWYECPSSCREVEQWIHTQTGFPPTNFLT